MHKPNKDLDFMKEFLEVGKVVPVIDRRYPLSEVAEAPPKGERDGSPANIQPVAWAVRFTLEQYATLERQAPKGDVKKLILSTVTKLIV